MEIAKVEKALESSKIEKEMKINFVKAKQN